MRFIVRRHHAASPLPATPSTTRQLVNSDERGASLLLALIFLTVISVVTVSLLSWIGNGLTDSLDFKSARTTESAANSAAELAMQYVRYNFDKNTINSPNPVPCTPNSLPSLNNRSMATYCRTQWLSASGSRNVIISVCQGGDSLACENQPLLQADIILNDNSLSSKNNCTPGTSGSASTTTCGSGLNVENWVIDATPPTVTSVVAGTSLPKTCTDLDGTLSSPFVITGTGFLYNGGGDPTVSLADSTSDATLPSYPIQVIDSSTIYACRPLEAQAGVNYWVTVATPSGTSAYNSGSSNVISF